MQTNWYERVIGTGTYKNNNKKYSFPLSHWTAVLCGNAYTFYMWKESQQKKVEQFRRYFFLFMFYALCLLAHIELIELWIAHRENEQKKMKP